MSTLRQDASPPQKRTAYLADRLDDQITFYSGQAHRFHTSRNRLRWAMIGCYVIGAFLLPFNGLAALTTAAGALGTWVAAKHYSDLVQSYSAMARNMQVQRTKQPTWHSMGPLHRVNGHSSSTVSKHSLRVNTRIG